MKKKLNRRSSNVPKGSSVVKEPPSCRCRSCGKDFLGALYDGQPDDECYDCFETVIKSSGTRSGSILWQKLRRIMNPDSAYKTLKALKDLDEEGYVKILVEH